MEINPKYVQWGIYGALGLVMAYEIFAAFNKSEGDTISEVIWSMKNHPMIPLIIGVLIGHFFWTGRK